jgi:hypothetical protein
MNRGVVTRRAALALSRLESLCDTYDGGVAATKLELLRRLERGRLSAPDAVRRLHEVLCFLRAYPDDAAVLARVEKMLAAFAERSDLRRHAESLANSGIAGTPIDFRFYWYSASWLARRWPAHLFIDWPEFDQQDRLVERLSLLMPYAEGLALEEMDLPARKWLERLKGPEETDGAFLVRRLERLVVDPVLRESYYEEMDIPYRLQPGPDTPSRTRARYAQAPVVFRSGPLVRARSAFRPALRRPLDREEAMPPRAARTLIALAREAMIARGRDLDAFIHADPKDVRMFGAGDGLQVACYGTIPERRQLLDAAYGLMMLENGVPVGYAVASALFESAEIAFTVFETFRDAESAHLFGRLLAVARRLFGADAFVLDPFQLGHENPDALASGAWWFYCKLGFRPRNAAVRRLVSTELGKLRTNPHHRSSATVLRRLSAAEMYLHLGRPRRDVIGVFSRQRVGLRIIDYLAHRFGADREAGVRTCADEVSRLLGVRSLAGFSRDERQAWMRWSPLVRILPGLERWPRSDKAALVQVIRAKAGRRESDFVALFDRHRRLRRAVAALG